VIIAAEYSFNDGHAVVQSRWPHLVEEIEEIIDA
jgi:hypothetical protein